MGFQLPENPCNSCLFFHPARMRILSGLRTHSKDSLVFQWHSSSLSRRTIRFFRLACLIFSGGCIWAFFAIREGYADNFDGDGGEWVALGVGIISGLAGFFLLFETHTTIDPIQRHVWRDWVFLGWFVLFPRRFDFTDFKAVSLRRDVDSESAWDTYFLGLKRQNGRRLWIRYWSVPQQSSSEPVRTQAGDLARVFGVPVES